MQFHRPLILPAVLAGAFGLFAYAGQSNTSSGTVPAQSYQGPARTESQSAREAHGTETRYGVTRKRAESLLCYVDERDAWESTDTYCRSDKGEFEFHLDYRNPASVDSWVTDKDVINNERLTEIWNRIQKAFGTGMYKIDYYPEVTCYIDMIGIGTNRFGRVPLKMCDISGNNSALDFVLAPAFSGEERQTERYYTAEDVDKGLLRKAAVDTAMRFIVTLPRDSPEFRAYENRFNAVKAIVEASK